MKNNDKTKKFPNLWRLTPYIKLYRWRIIFTMALLLASKVFSVADPYVTKKLIDYLVGGSAIKASVIAGFLILFFALRWGTNLLDGAKDYLFAKVQTNLKRFISLDVFEHLLSLPLAFHADRSTGGISRKITRGVSALEQIFWFLSFNIIPTIIEIILVIAIFMRLFPVSFTLVFLVFIFVYVAFTIGYTEYRQAMLLETNKQDDVVSGVSIDALLNYETVKYFANEKYEHNRLNAALDSWVGLGIKSTKMGANLNMGQGLIITAGLTAILSLAVIEYSHGHSTIGDFILVSTYLARVAAPLNFLGFMYRGMKEALANIDEMFKLLNVENALPDLPGASELLCVDGLVEFKDVNFSYNDERKIFDKLNFTVPPKKRVALVGYSGSGKSTVSKLLLRMYDVTGGSIELDGKNIKEATQESLRRQIGIVAQDSVLFNDTIRYNIAYGRIGATLEEVEAVAKIANIHDFITSLPNGYETVVGERGVKLSGGEKQRVAIARILIKDPKILVFDEATASLDTKSEKIIQEAINKISQGGRTTIVIAHRLSTIVDFDKIIVLDQGRVAEEGTHQELMAKNGIYAKLWLTQSQAGEVQNSVL
jgi:ATP-binding cassette subfamily B protein